MTDLRSLCARMADELDYLRQLLRDDRREIHALAAEARAVLAQPPADGEVAELVQWLRSQDGGLGKRAIHSRIADLLERQHRPIPVSERLPEAGEMTGDGEVWVEEIGCEYPLGDTGDHDWEPHKWILRPIGRFDAKKRLRWLPAAALPLPSEEEA